MMAVLAFCFAAWLTVEAADKDASDVRLVIDISGSMKKNDPQNLRVPAVRLLTNLMPSGSKAGIWTFGQYVNNLLPVKTVDATWQQQASVAANQINSLGAFTNIPDALDKAMDGWDGAGREPRHLILLTDGVVDISKDATANIKARQQLIDEILPKLKAARVHVHTIALSRDADAELLGKIARETDALFEMVDSADALNKVFLRIFEQSAPRDTVPLNDNRFNVDSAIEEFTLLVFKNGERDVKLITPSAQYVAKAQALEGWRWYSDARYDLITVTKPQAGEWRLEADVDPDNRVMVVSKLGLKIDELPRMMMPGEQLQFNATLLDDNKPVSKPEFLELVSAKALVALETQTTSIDLNGDGNGHFAAAWTAPENTSAATINITVQSPTFVRSRQFSVQIAQGSIALTRVAHDDKQSRFELTWSRDVLAEGSVKITAKLLHDGQATELPIQHEHEQFFVEVNHESAGEYHVELNVNAKSSSGRDVSLRAQSESWQVAAPVTEHEPAVEHDQPKATDEHSAEAPSDDHAKKAEPEKATTENDDEHGWLFWTLAAVVNVVLLLVGGGIWWMIKRKQKSASEDIEKALGGGS